MDEKRTEQQELEVSNVLLFGEVTSGMEFNLYSK